MDDATGPVDRRPDDEPIDADVAALVARAARARRASDPSDGPDADAAVAAARDGLGAVVGRYIEARTGRRERLSAASLRGLDRACNDWLVVYSRRHGVECDPDVPVRTAAEALVDTHDVVATARLLTGVPPRS